MSQKKLEELFLEKAYTSHGVFLLKPCDARDFVTEAKVRGFPIAGIEGFHRIGGFGIQPDQALSTDLYDFDGDTWYKTLVDLEGPFDDDVWFEVILE